MDATALRHWPVTPTGMARAPEGRNNEVYFVDAREGAFVLRAYRGAADLGRVRDEHDLLGALALQDLPFAVPAPAPTRDGDTVAVIESGDGPRIAALFPRIPGEAAPMTALAARLAGRALAQVDVALSRLDRPIRAPATARDVHPLVPDPLGALDELALGPSVATGRALIEHALEVHDALVGSLPTQIVHGDFAYPNVLMADGAVTGVLDYEFAAPDVRAADLATAMYVTVVRSVEPVRWTLLEALASGYRRSLPLDPVEAAAVPELMRRRNVLGIVHWLGRAFEGTASRQEPIDRIARGVMLGRWLDENAAWVAATVMGARADAKRV